MAKPNILLIVIDALRARNLSCYGYDKLTSPNIDALAQKGVLFENCFSTTNVTDPSFTTILSGKYPASHGMIEQGVTSPAVYRKKLEGLVMLQSILKEHGYLTIGVDWLGRWHAQGYDYYSGAISKRLMIFNEVVFRKIKNSKFVDAIIEFIKRKTSRGVFSRFYLAYDKASIVTDYALKTLSAHQEANFFLFIHYWDTHMPYNPPSNFISPFRGSLYTPHVEKPQDILKTLPDNDWRYFLQDFLKGMESTTEALARYDGSLLYVDSEIGRLLDNMRSRGMLDNTLVIITADHGESHTAHGIYFDHHGLYDELIHVPLIIYYPERVAPRRIKTTIQHIDLVPTILDLAGITYVKDEFDGKSLVPCLTGEAEIASIRPFVYVEEARSERKFALRTDKFKYIFAESEKDALCNYCGRIHGGIEELYDLGKDPDETHNILNEKPEIRNELRKILLMFREGLETKREKQRLGARIKKLKMAEKI
ncbi:MAG: sulfatase [Chloroflexota bacterium]